MSRANKISGRNYDRHLNTKTFLVSQKVLLKNSERTSKLSEHWLGPYDVKTVHNRVNVSLDIGNKIKRVHVNRLKAHLAS